MGHVLRQVSALLNNERFENLPARSPRTLRAASLMLKESLGLLGLAAGSGSEFWVRWLASCESHLLIYRIEGMISLASKSCGSIEGKLPSVPTNTQAVNYPGSHRQVSRRGSSAGGHIQQGEPQAAECRIIAAEAGIKAAVSAFIASDEGRAWPQLVVFLIGGPAPVGGNLGTSQPSLKLQATLPSKANGRPSPPPSIGILGLFEAVSTLLSHVGGDSSLFASKSVEFLQILDAMNNADRVLEMAFRLSTLQPSARWEYLPSLV